jgi:eukaryotic-like serine/threonine-protein kinase
LADIVERLHAKEPDGRYESATEVAELLQHHLAELQRAGTSVPPRPMPPAPKRQRLGRKPFAALALISAALFAAVLSGLLYSVLPPREPSPRAADGDPSAAPIIGSGHPAIKSWNIADFSAVKLESAFQAEISKGDGFKVTTSSDDNVIEHIQVLKEDKTLSIRLKRGQKLQLKEPLKATIVLPVLDALTLRDASKALLKGFRSEENLKLVLRDASTVEGTLDVGSADFQLRDASTLTLTGTAADARLSGHDGSHLKLQQFVLKQCKIKLADASTARIAVRSDKPFRAELSDASCLSGSVEARDLEIKLRNASQATLSGAATNAELAAADSSNLRLAGLILEDARIILSDISHATVHVRKSLKYVLSSQARLEYLGDNVTLSGSKSGRATIRRRP